MIGAGHVLGVQREIIHGPPGDTGNVRVLLVPRHRHFIRHTTLVCSVVLPVYWLMVTIGKDGDGTFGLVGL